MSATLSAPRSQSAGIVTASGQIARRVLLRFLRTPQLVVVGTMQGAMFLLIFRYVFGGAITTGSIDYVDFVVPGFITTGVLFNAMYAVIGVAEDMNTGLISRLRSLPIPRSAVLIGRAIADTGIQVWGLAVTVALGFLVGFRVHNGWGSVLAAAGLVILFSVVFEWLFILMGLLAGSPEAAQGFALIVFPLTFVSSAYIPVETMPGWMQGFAQNQPMTVMVDAVRALTQGAQSEILLGHGATYYVVRSLLWSVGLVAIFVPLAVAKYARR